MIVYTDYPTDTRVRREAETLALLPEYNVSVLSLKEGEAPLTYDLDGVHVIELNEKKYCGKSQTRYVLSYVKFLMLSFIRCAKFFFQRKIDIVHVHNMPNFLVFSAFIPRVFGKKIILDIHDSVPETYATKFSGLGRLLFRLLCIEELLSCAFANRIICVNHVQSDVLIQRGIPEEKITISMNVLDHRKFKSVSANHGRKRSLSGFRAVYHGTIAMRLGIDLILRAIAHLKNKIPDLEFHVWGRGGDDLDEILIILNQLGIQDKVHFNDAIPMDALIPKLLDMSIGIIGNRRSVATELMLPVKLLEYVALGIPVVAPRLKAIQYYFTEEMVTYYEPEDVDSMAEAILKLYENPSLRKAQAEKAKTFLDKYGWEKHKMDLINLYKQL